MIQCLRLGIRGVRPCNCMLETLSECWAAWRGSAPVLNGTTPLCWQSSPLPLLPSHTLVYRMPDSLPPPGPSMSSFLTPVRSFPWSVPGRLWPAAFPSPRLNPPLPTERSVECWAITYFVIFCSSAFQFFFVFVIEHLTARADCKVLEGSDHTCFVGHYKLSVEHSARCPEMSVWRTDLPWDCTAVKFSRTSD